MEIQRTLLHQLIAEGPPIGKVWLLIGPRRVGKTRLVQAFLQTTQLKPLVLNGESAEAQQLLAPASIAHYKRLLQGIELLVIDEAQAVPAIGQRLKLIVDELPGLRILATGSSPLQLQHSTGEPLTGRVHTRYLLPVWQQELQPTENILQTRQNLSDRLVLGSYPELFNLPTRAQQEEYLREIVASYLLKDILQLTNIRNPAQLRKLLQLVAYQIGQEVSLNELASSLQIQRPTVQTYLDLLEQVFVLRRVGGYSGNLRKEVVKSAKYYFYDLGIRNALIADFRLLPQRQDIGALWENYCIAERLKQLNYSRLHNNTYFWRTYDQQEIDWVEAAPDHLAGYELKYTPPARTKPPVAWAKAYPHATYQVVTPENYLDFILPG
ncbi:MAG: ATP-binding protein [Bacteroidia bacterium]|nr:ATP-binding protein [Bacteroidia bacterium]